MRITAALVPEKGAPFRLEALELADPGPDELVVRITPFLVAMKGTNAEHPRCVALEGQIGEAVRCTIHPVRASVCRDFPPSYEDGTPNERCDKARALHGLPPLTPEDWADD